MLMRILATGKQHVLACTSIPNSSTPTTPYGTTYKLGSSRDSQRLEYVKVFEQGIVQDKGRLHLFFNDNSALVIGRIY